IIRGGRSFLGPTGDGAIRCVYLTNGASLSGFTLTGGGTRNTGDFFREEAGGGLWCESVSAVVSNCVILENSSSAFGGGVYSGTLKGCTLTTNSAENGRGGGAYESRLNNCTLIGN